METTDYGELYAVLDATMETYGRMAPGMNDAVVDLWFRSLRKYSIADIRNALSRHVTDPDTGQFPPKIADVVKLLEGSGTDRATLAWAKLLKAAGRVGRYRSVAFDDPIIHAVVEDMGGWSLLCDMTDDDLRHEERRFCEKYRSFVRHGCPDYPPYIVGLEEQEQRAQGYLGQIKPPMLIGEPQAAQAAIGAGRGGHRIGISERPAQGLESAVAGALERAGPGAVSSAGAGEPAGRRAPPAGGSSVDGSEGAGNDR